MQKHRILVTAWMVLGAAGALAQTGPATDRSELSYRVEKWFERHEVSADGSEVMTFSTANKILKADAIERLKTGYASYSKSAQSMQILEAYTVKANGKKVVAPKTNYQLSENKGYGKSSPAFSDHNTMTVVFPDVAVGDTVVLSYRIKTLDPLFPGRISLMGAFSRQIAYDDVHVQIVAPEAFKARYQVRGMEEKVSTAGGRRTIDWTLKAPDAVRSKRRDYSVVDPLAEPGFAYTSFESYLDVASNYGRRALPKAMVTPRIQTLADQTTQGIADRREQVRALYDWVATQITYGGNCIGIGAVVPRDLDVVLDNRMGDCKDHATLLQALLAAKGIPAEQALINAGSVYRLPDLPLAQLVNHVINYVPEFDLFMDSTSDDTPLGWLPQADLGKPVLMVNQTGLPARTPAAQPLPTAQKVKARLAISAEGTVSGQVEVELTGLIAPQVRQHFKRLSPQQEKDFVHDMLSQGNSEAEGSIVHGDDAARSPEYRYSAEFSAKDLVQFPGSGSLYIYPLIFTPFGVHQFVAGVSGPAESVEIACSGGRSEEDYEIALPESMTVLSLPEDTKVSTDLVDYEASHVLKDHVLSVHRVLVDKTDGPICSPELIGRYRSAMQPVQKNLRQQMLYR